MVDLLQNCSFSLDFLSQMGGGPEDEAPEDEWEVVSPDADVGAGSEPSEPADAQGAEGAKSEEGQEPPAEGDHPKLRRRKDARDGREQIADQ